MYFISLILLLFFFSFPVSTMRTTSLTASLILVISLFIATVHAQNQGIDRCDGITNNTRSQICLSGKCPFTCGSVNESAYSKCDQVCVEEPCASLSCNSSECFQRCLAGGCESLHCSSDDCTQTCMGNCSRVNCTMTSKCNQQCEKGHCGLHASGDGVVVQNCAEMCSDVKCEADDCRQVCEGEGCGLECSKGMSKWHAFITVLSRALLRRLAFCENRKINNSNQEKMILVSCNNISSFSNYKYN